MSLAGKKRRSKKANKAQKIEASATNEPTKSSKKRDKKMKNPDHVHETKGQSKALRYLKLWYSNKKAQADDIVEPWKFEKCRQIWLLQNCYDGVRVPPEDFKILLKYMATINGRMRDGAIGDAKEKVDLTEKWNNLSVEGKNETDVEKEIGKPKPDDLTIKRARKIIKKLNKDPESVSS